jgi:hypothetical protein
MSCSLGCTINSAVWRKPRESLYNSLSRTSEDMWLRYTDACLFMDIREFFLSSGFSRYVRSDLFYFTNAKLNECRN